MGLPSILESQSILPDVGANNVGDKGCKYLSMIPFTKILYLILSTVTLTHTATT
jgi:hypothetical protein